MTKLRHKAVKYFPGDTEWQSKDIKPSRVGFRAHLYPVHVPGLPGCFPALIQDGPAAASAGLL